MVKVITNMTIFVRKSKTVLLSLVLGNSKNLIISLNLKRLEGMSFVKTIIIYESVFGNTKKVADTIRENLDHIEKNEIIIKSIKEVDPSEVLDYDLILFGSPNHMGGPTRGIKKLIDKLENIDLKGKKVATFDTYVRKNVNKAVRKMEQRIKEKIPDLELITPGLSIKVNGVGGPIIETEFPKCVEFAKLIIEKMKALDRNSF